jgi:hypothetical protein
MKLLRVPINLSHCGALFHYRGQIKGEKKGSSLPLTFVAACKIILQLWHDTADRISQRLISRNEPRQTQGKNIFCCRGLWSVYQHSSESSRDAAPKYRCLPPCAQNHYHLLQTHPRATYLVACGASTTFTPGAPTAAIRKTPLFRRRYKAVLVDGDSYLPAVLRYIYRNPLKARIVKKLEDFAWNSHKGYISNSRNWDWLPDSMLRGTRRSAAALPGKAGGTPLMRTVSHSK